jgi:hypothetical protein
MTEHEASRTLVKSPPELWAELSDPSSLAGHLAESFGEIRITRLEPETAVAWEGERASGTVRIEPSGWGTRVTLTAREPAAEPPVAEEHSPAAEEPAAEPPAAEEHSPAAEEPAAEPPAAEEHSPAAEEPPAEPPAAEEPAAAEEPPAVSEPEPLTPRPGLLGRLRGWLGGKRAAAAPPEPAAALPAAEEKTAPEVDPAAAPEVDPAPAPESDPAAALVGVLDRLGAAHRRPFSRS